MIRYSKTFSDKYLSSTAEFCSECLKFLISLLLYLFQYRKEVTASPPHTISLIQWIHQRIGKEMNFILLAALYLLQNNLKYIASSRLEATTFQIINPLKIISTAIASRIILKRKLFQRQWIAIGMLLIGVTLVQFPMEGIRAIQPKEGQATKDKIIGVVALLLACTVSGVSDVFFEKILKTSKLIIWVRNAQLSFFSTLLGYFISVLLLLDGDAFKENGFFGGYTRWTISTILLQALRGIIIIIVIKYADCILKNFAIAISIVLAHSISYFAFDSEVTLYFSIGTLSVLYATFLYGKKTESTNTTMTNYRLFYSKLEEGKLTEKKDYALKDDSTKPLNNNILKYIEE